MLKNKKIKKLALLNAVALVSFASASLAGFPSITLEQTVGVDLTPGACGTDAVISVDPGTQVNFCYTVTNDGGDTLELHDLDTSVFGSLISGFPQQLMPSDSYTFNDIRTVSSNLINDAEWTSIRPVTYNVTTVPFVFDDISATGQALGLGDDSTIDVVLPFAFSLYGNSSTDMRISNNGAVLIGDTTNGVGFSNQTFPIDVLPMIAPLWDDHADATGDVFYEVLGVAPNQVAIVQWHDRNHFNSDPGETVTFQLALFEGSNEIQFRYLDLIYDGSGGLDNGASATIGLNQGDGATSYTYPDPVMDMVAVSLIPAGSLLTASDTSTTAVSVLTPDVAVNPGSFNVTVDDVVGITSEVLVISNEGQGSLEWSVDEATVPAVMPRPVSFYQPEAQENQSLGPAPRVGSKSFGKNSLEKNLLGGATAYAAQVFPNNAFGTMNIADASFTPIVDPSNETFFAGDLVGGLTTMYAINNDDSSLYSIDVTNGSTTLIGATSTINGENWTGISWDSTTDTVYASSAACGTASTLYTLDVSTGAATAVGPITNGACIIDIAVSASGQMYGHDIVSDSIVAIDKSTGAGTVIGATGFDANFAQGMDFDWQTDTLYLAAYNNGAGDTELRTVDLQTGATTLVGSQPGQDEIGAFGIATSNDTCYSPSDISWLSMTNTSGVVGANDTDEVMVDFDATGLAVGVYSAKICVFTNDMDEPLVSVPVSMEVSDLIYANGFEAPAP